MFFYRFSFGPFEYSVWVFLRLQLGVFETSAWVRFQTGFYGFTFRLFETSGLGLLRFQFGAGVVRDFRLGMTVDSILTHWF